MESIEKLREMVMQREDGWLKLDLLKLADEIGRDIAERYMELPTDADGIPIHIGDMVLEIDGADPDEVTALFLRGYEWQVEGAYICCDADKCKHVKHRTVEDVLRDFIAKVNEPQLGSIDHRVEVYAPKYAAEIREILGVSE